MRFFGYKDGEYCCEEVPLRKIAESVGTPFYCYSSRTIERHFNVFDSALEGVDHLVCFAVKANSNIAVLRLLGRLGSGADIVSGGELFRAIKAGIDPKKIVYAGVGKSKEEIKMALEAGILIFNVESYHELLTIDSVANSLNKKASCAIRVNPDVDPKTHPGIATGLKTAKFGISYETAVDTYKRAKMLRNIDVVGIHKHIGSQVTQIKPYAETLTRIVELISLLKSESIDIQYINIGGGLGIVYKDEVPPEPKDLADLIKPIMQGIDAKIMFEPGRVIVGNAGALVTKVLYSKSNDLKNFLIVDAAMNDLARPSLYGSYHSILPVEEHALDAESIVVDVVGPICESSDYLAKDRSLPKFKYGDLLAVMSSGAYGFTMSSNYNSRCRVPEVLVKDDQFHVIRNRETYEDLIANERIPDFLK